MFLSVLFWLLAHNTIWHVVRLDRVWRAIIPAGLVLVINNAFYTGDANVDIYVIGFMFFALLLIVHNNTRTREYEWRRQRIRFTNSVHRGFMRFGAMLSIVVLLFTQLLPVGYGEDNWQKFEEFLQSDPVTAIAELWSRLFSSLDGQGVATTDYYGGDRLDLTGAVQLSDEPVMEVEILNANPASFRFYWRSSVFDVYDGRGWERQRTVIARGVQEGMTLNTGDYAARRDIQQHFTMFIAASPLVYAAPEARQIENVVVEAELNCVTGGDNCINQNLEADVAIIRANTPLRRNDEYMAVSSISIADASLLQQAGTNYPAWVLPAYIQGGDRVSEEVKNLTQSIILTTGAQNPYDVAKAIEQYLRNNITYNERIPAPPFNQDPIDWFLFDIQQGYCNYYATAMVMMLRSQGIPARMSAGFAEGVYQGNNTYLVKENDAHTWVEVFFPGYGWVTFEPTADESPVDRAGDPTFDDNPLPTPTMPTPSITPTLQPTQQQTEAFVPPTATPTITPTPTDVESEVLPAVTSTPQFNPTSTLQPTPTPTLPPAPVLTNVVAGDDDNIFELILLFLLAMVSIVTTVVLTVLFVIWWIEHRGLGGLNPVQKAYARLAIYGRWLGINLSNRQSPNERQHVLVQAVPDGQDPIQEITTLYSQDRFGAPMPDEQRERASEIAKEAWSDARFAFIRRKFSRKPRKPKH